MSSTISLDTLEKFSNNLYEAIVVIAKRAKQINEEQKSSFEIEPDLDETMDIYDEDEEIEEQGEVEKKIVRLPKPTELAIQEMLAGRIKWDYGIEETIEDRDN
ncbi:MAG: DNA-directed RNA polymerase subunit omega [bacterium]|nr:MAG: DNA-directed RNA polymerase subunit omega [bacterium]